MTARSDSQPFVGRAAELADLRQAVDVASGGRATTVVIAGEAGIGKSTLVSELTAGLPGVTVLGSCIDCGESPLPYGALTDALRSLERALDGERRERLVAPARANLAALLAGLDSDASAEDRYGARTRLFGAVLELLVEVATVEPVVLVIEDVHWSDRSTRDLLAYLVANLGDAPVLVVLTCRTDGLPKGHPIRQFLAQLARSRSVRRMDLEPFTRDEIADQLAAIAGSAPDDELVEMVWSRSEGNPLFAEELFAEAARRRHRDLGGPLPLPDSLSDLLLARLSQLSDGTQVVLRAAAVGGPKVSHGLLAAVVGADDDGLVGEVREAVDHGVLVPDNAADAYEFRHVLLREVACSELLPGELRRLHRRFGEELTADPGLCASPAGVAAELARHWDAAGEAVLALPAALEAADRAEKVFGFAEASQHFERVLDLWERVGAPSRPAGVEYLVLLQRAASARNLAGDHQRAAVLVRAAIDEAVVTGRADGPTAGRLWVSLGRYLWAGGRSEESLAAYEQAVHQVPDDGPSVVRAEVLAAQAEALREASHFLASRKRAEEAIAVARQVGDAAQERDASTTLGYDLVMLGDPDGGLDHLRRSLELARSMNDSGAIATSYHNLANALSGPLCRLKEAWTVVDAGLRWAGDHGLEKTHGGLALHALAADTLFRLGQWDEAERYVARGLAWDPSGAVEVDLLLARAKLAVGRGRFREATNDLQAATERSARAIDTRFKLPLSTLDAGLALWQGRPEDARDAVAEGLEVAIATDDVWFSLPLLWHGLRADADAVAHLPASKRSRRGAIEARGEEWLTQARKLVETGPQRGGLELLAVAYGYLCEGEAARLRGDGDGVAWAAAAEAWTALAQPYPAAYALWRQAEVVLNRPGGAGASMLLRNAHRAAVRLGATPLRKDIEELAKRARIGLDPAPEPASGEGVVDLRDDDGGMGRVAERFSLTKREREVLEQLTEGCTNRQIADRLFISEKTASVHVSNILGKLNARSRVEAAGIALRIARETT